MKWFNRRWFKWVHIDMWIDLGWIFQVRTSLWKQVEEWDVYRYDTEWIRLYIKLLWWKFDFKLYSPDKKYYKSLIQHVSQLEKDNYQLRIKMSKLQEYIHKKEATINHLNDVLQIQKESENGNESIKT